MNILFLLLLILGSVGITFGQKTGNVVVPPPTSAVKAAEPARPDLPKCALTSGLTRDEIVELVAAHNRARAEVKVAPIVWDCQLAVYAQEWAAKAIAAHRETDLG